MDAVLRSVKRVCYAGLDSVTLRREVVARVERAVPFDATAFSTCDPDTGFMSHTIHDRVPAPVAKLFVERLYPHVCAWIAVDLPRKGVPVFSMLEQSQQARSELRALGVSDQVHVALAADGRLWGSWCLLRLGDSPVTTDRDRALLRRLVPHITRGLQTAALIDEGLARSRDRHDDAAPGVLVLDARSRPVVRTPLAAAWLDDLADVGLRLADDLPLCVLALVTQLRRARADVPAEVRVRVRGRSGRWYVLRASLAEPDAAGTSAVVVVLRPAVPREMATILTSLYDLSEREREVVAAVARGEPTKAIAAALGLSPYTVTEHIERACRKIGVRGRKALIAKLFFDGYAPFLRSERPVMRATGVPIDSARPAEARSA